jgi:hypothetical protein
MIEPMMTIRVDAQDPMIKSHSIWTSYVQMAGLLQPSHRKLHFASSPNAAHQASSRRTESTLSSLEKCINLSCLWFLSLPAVRKDSKE